jgi:hypothetical protein
VKTSSESVLGSYRSFSHATGTSHSPYMPDNREPTVYIFLEIVDSHPFSKIKVKYLFLQLDKMGNGVLNTLHKKGMWCII